MSAPPVPTPPEAENDPELPPLRVQGGVGLLLVVMLVAILAGSWLYTRRVASPATPDLSATLPASPAAVHPGEPLQALDSRRFRLDPARVALGKALFHDTRLSRDGSLSCASCHDLGRGGADGRVHSLGVAGAEGVINAPTVLNAALNFRQFWDGRAATLEEQAAGPVTNPLEMATTWPEVIARLNADPALPEQFARSYAEGLTESSVRHAIAEFERSLLTPSRFDRWLQGDELALNAEEKQGYQLFKKHGCVACHQGMNIGGNLYQRFGIIGDYFADRPRSRHEGSNPDLGRFNQTGQQGDRHVFKVPGLRNVALTAPYFHDGSAATLEQAVSMMGFYQLGLTLPEEDIKRIVAFLNSLTGEIPQ